jgi:hypothetical protein
MGYLERLSRTRSDERERGRERGTKEWTATALNEDFKSLPREEPD